VEEGQTWFLWHLDSIVRPCAPDSDCAALARNANGDLVVDENQMTSQTRVFAGGDLVHGPGRLADTVRDARKGAKAIHLYLSTRIERDGEEG
jgi:NADPH-dependent glutamate synthase beta subunit-like oxidoreductase